MAADGSIRVEVKLDNSEAKTEIEELIKTAQKTKKRLEDLSQNNQIKIDGKSAEKTLKKLRDDIEKYEMKLQELQAGKYKKYTEAVNSNETKTNELIPYAESDEQVTSLLELEEQQLKAINEKYATTVVKVEQVSKKLMDAVASANQLADAAQKSYFEQQASDIGRLENEIGQAVQNQKHFTASTYETRGVAQTLEKAFVNMFGAVKSDLQFIKQKIPGIGHSIKSGMVNTLKKAGSTLAKMTVYPAKLTFKGAIKGAKLFWAELKKIPSLISKIHTKMKGINTDSTKMGKIFGKMGLALIGVEGVFTGIRQIVSSALSSNQQLQNQITAIKGILGQSIAPIINFLVSGLGQIVAFADKIYQIFTGTSLVAKYNASAMAQAAENTAGAADSAKEYKRQLAGFDEMNKLSSNDSASSGVAGGGADAPALFETPDMNSWLAGITEQIKAGDWEGVGTTIAQGINSAIEKINWNSVQNKVNAFANNLGKSANAFMGALDWKNVGNTIGEALNTITGAISTFVDSTDWGLLGAGVATSLNGLVDSINAEDLGKTLTAKLKIIIDSLHGFLFGSGENEGFNFANLGIKIGEVVNEGFKNLDFQKAGQVISQGIKGLLTTIRKTLQTIDFKEIGKKLADGLNAIDWVGILSELAGSIGDLLVSALDLINGFVENVDWQKLASDVWNSLWGMLKSIDWGGLIGGIFELLGAAYGAYYGAIEGICEAIWQSLIDALKATMNFFSEEIDAAGGNILEGIKNGIIKALTAIDTWIRTNIFEPFFKGFCNAFGIHSPATSMEEPGENIIYGVFEGIKGIMANVGEWLKTNVFDKFASAWKNFEALKVELVGDIKQTFKDAKNKFDSVKSKTATLTNAVKNSQVVTNFKATYDKIKNKTVTVTANAVDKASSVFKKIANSFIDFINRAISKINSKLKIKIPGTLQKILSAVGVSVPTGSYQLFSIPSIPKLAKGGIVNNPGRGVDITAGEAGREAVLPLDRHTEWMDTLAQKVGFGSITIPIYLDGKIIAKYVIDLQSRKAFELNKGGAY